MEIKMGRKLNYYSGLICVFLCLYWSSSSQVESGPYNQETGADAFNTEEVVHQVETDSQNGGVESPPVHPIVHDVEKEHTGLDAEVIAEDMKNSNTNTEQIDDATVNANASSSDTNNEMVNEDVNVEHLAPDSKRSGHPDDTNESDDDIDPLAELEMMAELEKAKIMTAESFCEHLIGGCEVIKGDPSMEEGDKVLVSGDDSGGEFALYDACNPRNMTIALPRDHDPDISIWPTCTRAVRCGGCCTSDVFSCEPTKTKEKFVKIFRTRQPYKYSTRFQFVGAKTVKIIEHTQCDAQCKVKAIHCNPLQIYKPRLCRCVCTNQDMRKACSPEQIWDDNECACICPNRATSFCPSPSRFSDHACRCTFKEEVAGHIDLAKFLSSLGKDLVVGANNEITLAPTTTPAPTTTTTKPTTTPAKTAAPTTPADRCKHLTCRPPWKAQWLGRNDAQGKPICQCRPAFG